MKFHCVSWALGVFCALCLISTPALPNPPQLQLAKVYQQDVDLTDYWVSEKYDGYRAYWDGQQLISRQGSVFAAPEWFVRGFPNQPLDGELWIGRGQFEQLASIVKRQTPHSGWSQVRYMVFDLPSSSASFDHRWRHLQQLIASSNNPYLTLVPQFKLESQSHLLVELEQRVALGAEGLMLRRGSAAYRAGRNEDLLKLKPLQDMEAIVLKQLPGKGKYHGKMGSLLVETTEGVRFRLGTGFSDHERAQPPAIGAVVTFQFSGLTARGIPRFARFLRVREQPADN